MAKKGRTKFPAIKEANEGKFTKWAEKNMPGKSVCSAASSVLKNKDRYKGSVVKMANFGCKRK